MEPIEPLDRTFRHAQRVIAGITPNQYDNVTPCSEWNVRQVLEHTMGVVAGMGQALVGAQRTEFVLADDPGHQFEQIASDAIAAWRADGVLDQVVNFGAGTPTSTCSIPPHIRGTWRSRPVRTRPFPMTSRSRHTKRAR